MEKVIGGNKELKKYLSPEWLLDCVMFDRKHSSLVISPTYLHQKGIHNIKISQNIFGSKTILTFKTDFNLIKVKKT